LVPSCFAIFDLEPLSLSFDFVISSEIFKSLSFNLDRLCHLTILCLVQHAHTLHHLESLLTISLDRLDILKDDLVYQSLRKLVPSCFTIFDLEPLSLSFDFVISSEIFKYLSFNLDRLCHLTILCLVQHAHTLHHLESLLTISLDRLDILKDDLVYQSLRKSLILELS
nr:hypothetical protein [Tanacetum cinerariifolium]